MSRVPRIRFKGFEEDWEQRKLGEIAERIIRKNEKLESTLPLTISAQYGLIDQNEFFDKRIASKDVRGYYLIKKGEFAYNKSTSVDAPLGAIKRLDKYKNGVLSTLYILFKIIDDTSTSSDYLVTYYATDLWHRGIQSIAAEGARNHGLLNIAPNDFFETMLSIPINISEQKKVGDFFISFDHLITLHQSKSFGHILKAIVSCTLSWEQRKLGEIGTTYSGLSGKTKDDFGHGQASFITYMNVYSNPVSRCDMVEPIEIDNRQNEVEIGDVFFTTSSETPEEVGMTSVLTEKRGIIYLNSFCFGFRPFEKIDKYYLAYMLRSKNTREKIILLAQGISRYNISKNKVMEIPVEVPSFDEQIRIGKKFHLIDHLITLHQLEPFQLIFKAIGYRIIDYAKSKPPRSRK